MRRLLFLMLTLAVLAQNYDPMQEKDHASKIRDLTLHDGKRDVPIRIYLPPHQTGPAPVVLFSHGLGGSREMSAYLGMHWSNRGYVVVALQHPGSDVSVWQDKKPGQRLGALKSAANGEQLKARVGDVKFVLDELTTMKGVQVDMTRVGMSGHSFGAVTTQAVSGQVYPLVGRSWTDARIQAAIAFSPSVPRAGDRAKAFAQVKIPWMLMTGTEDVAPVGGMTVQDRLAVYPLLPPGGKYELVMKDAKHSVFTERVAQDPRYHVEILSFSTAFWDAYLRGDGAARAWLDGAGAKAALGAEDTWQHK